MNSIIAAAVFGVLGGGVTAIMKYETNRRLLKGQPEEIENLTDTAEKEQDALSLDGEVTSQSAPYGKRFYIFCAVAVVLSALCGYRMTGRVLLLRGMIELGVCYFAALAAAVVDLKTRTIPNYLPLSVVAVRLGVFVYELICDDMATQYLLSSLLGCFLCFVVLVIANRVSHGGIGGGDIKLLSSIGFACGFYVVCATMMVALISCIVLSAVLLTLKKRTLQDSLPFGPFIFIGLCAVCLFNLYY